MLHVLGINRAFHWASVLIASAVLVCTIFCAAPAQAAVLDQNQFLPIGNWGGGILYSTSTSPTAKIIATSSPSVGWITATSSTATSFFAGIVRIASTLILPSLTSGGLAVDASGNVYRGATTTAGTGLTFSGNAFNVNATQSITNLSNLTSDGYVKTSGGNGTLGIQAVPIPVADGGTATSTWYNNGVVFFSSTLGTLSQATSSSGFVYNRITGRVGIGTSTPSTPLSIDGTGAGSGILLGTAGAGYNQIYNSGGALSIQTSGNTIAFGSQGLGVESVRIAGGTGFVGVASSTPTALFSVHGNGYFSGNITNVANVTATGTVTTQNLTIPTISGTQCLHVTGTGQVSGTGSDCGSGSGATFAYPFNYSNNTGTSSPVLLVASTTIGAGAQATGLTVSGGATTTLNAYFGGNIGAGVQAPAARLVVSNQPAVQAPVSGSIAQYVGTDGAPLRITFDTHNNTNTSGTAMMIRRSRGSAAAPTAVLADDVLGSVNFRGYGTTGYAAGSTALMTAKAEGGPFTDTSMGTALTFDTTATTTVTAIERVRINGYGALGIGSTSPYAKLSVNGNSNDSTPFTTLFAVGSSTVSATTTLFSIANTGSTTAANGFNITAGCYAKNGVCLSTGGSASAASPTGGIQYNGGSNTFAATTSWAFTNTGGAANQIDLYDPTLTSNAEFYTDKTTAQMLLASASGSFTFLTGPSTTWDIQALGGATTQLHLGPNASTQFLSDGKFLAIGTTTPYSYLSVWGNSATAGNAFEAVNSASTTLFTVANNGRIGIGSTSPWAQLSVNANAIGTAPMFAVGSSTGTKFVVTNSGAVGIGTSSPSGVNPFFSVGTTTATAFWYGNSNKIGIGCENTSQARITIGCGSNANVNPNINPLITDPADARYGVSVNNQGVFTKAVGQGLYAYDYTAGAPLALQLQEFGNSVGISSSTPWATLSVNGIAGFATNQFVVGSSTQTSFVIDNKTHIGIGGFTPSMGTCGTSPSVTGSDSSGKITVGTGAVTSCAVNFARSFTTAPICTANIQSTVSTTTQITVNPATGSLTILSSASIGGSAIAYRCFGIAPGN